MTTALIPPGLTSFVQPLDTAVNGPFKKLLQEAADVYMEQLEETETMPEPWTLRNRREMATIIVGEAWDRLRKDSKMIKQAFLQYGISIHSDGREDHLINIKRVDNSSLDPNGWRGWSEFRSHEVVSDDFDYDGVNFGCRRAKDQSSICHSKAATRRVHTPEACKIRG
jgi:hypothetical protein